MGDYFEFAAGLGWTKVFGNGGRFGPGIPRDTPPVSPPGGETSAGVDSAGPIPCNTVRSHQIPSDPTRSQNFLKRACRYHKCYQHHRHTEYLRFLREIDHATPKGLDVHLIVDNYSAHKHERVKKWFVRHPHFHAHFIPTSSSWLNLVERFFRDITDRRIRRGIFHSVRELTKAIYDFLEHYNNNPRPFVWTKTADQILDKLAPLYAARG